MTTSLKNSPVGRIAGRGRRAAARAVSALGERASRERGPNAGRADVGRAGGGPHILIIVQNLPVPFDRRVWLECQALVADGYDVSVICPKGPGDPGRQVIDGVHIFKYAPPPAAEGVLGYAREFGYCWLRTAWLSVRAWRRRPFQVIQACNPPDTYWLLARFWQGRGVKFVFDQHDLNPELYLSRFGQPRSRRGKLQLAGLRWLEQMTYRTADHVISTNESYKAIAMGRGHKPDVDVTVVRSGPDTRTMRPEYPAARAQGERTFTLAYLGIMGPQDGVDTILDAMHLLTQKRGRTDVRAVLMGFGDCLEGLRQTSTELGLDSVVTFTGRADKRMIATHLSASDIGLCPDLKSPLNDVSTMNKTMEYMAYALPCVSFDLVETRVSAGDAGLYVESGDVQGFADAVERLLDDPDLRCDLALRARERVARELDWRPQAAAYVEVYRRLAGPAPRPSLSPSASTGFRVPGPRAEAGAELVDLDDTAELRRFIRDRSPRPTSSEAAGGAVSVPAPSRPTPSSLAAVGRPTNPSLS